MIVTENVVHKKLKIKFSHKRIEAGPGTGSSEFSQQVSDVDEQNHSTSDGSAQSEMSALHKCVASSSDGKMCSLADNLQSMSNMSGANKRGPPSVIEGQREKRQKIDLILVHQCIVILKQLMSHPAGWIFNTPVDPVALNIPDYFSVISEPMDLGTIKYKLEKKKYRVIEDFAADVRLTFSNAMLYNPPANEVHKYALQLSRIFERKWKQIDTRRNGESSKVELEKFSGGQLKEIQGSRWNCHKAPPLLDSSLPKRSTASERRTSESTQVELAKMTNNTASKMLSRKIHKGTDNGSRPACGSVNTRPWLSPLTCKCGSIKCRCNIPSDSTHTTLSDLSSERSVVGDICACVVDASNQDSQAKSSSASQMSRSDPDSDGAASALDEESLSHSSLLSVPAEGFSGEGWNTPLFDVHLSPKRALRAAKLKSRFADTILKAQQKTLLDHGDKADLAKLQQEKEKLERRQREEKARIEAEIKAAEAATRLRAETELKKQREREREAARVAVQKVVKTVEIEENVVILKELEVLGCSLYNNFLGREETSVVAFREFEGFGIRSPLEQLGLFIKDEYMGDVDDETVLNEDGEEGEILT